MNLDKIVYRYTAILAAIVILAGCATVGPDYVAPEIKAPSQ